MDMLMVEYVEGLVTLDDALEQEVERRAATFHAWHRQDQLDEYAQLLRAAQQDFTPGLTTERMRNAQETIRIQQQAGLLSGDRILRIDGQPMADWAALVAFVRAHADATVELEIARNGETLSLPLHIGSREAKSGRIGFIGAAPQAVGPPPAEMLTRQQYGPFTAIPHAVAKTWQLSSLTLRMIGKMLLGEVSVKNLSGPITIATYAGYTASAGITAFLYFLAVISISLGVLNLLPIPLLDGGHLMYYLVEIVRGRPLSEEVQMQLQRIGIAILGALMVLAFYNDLNRLWGG